MESKFVYACRAVLLIAFKNGAKPVLCKFTAEATAVDHEYSVLKALWQEPAVPGIDNNNNNLQAFQLIVARYLLGVPKSPVSQHALT